MVGTIPSLTAPQLAAKPDEPSRDAIERPSEAKATEAQTVSETALDRAPREVEDTLRAAEDALNDFARRHLGENTRLSIDTDDKTGKVIYRSVDKTSGEVLKQFPPEEFLRMIGSMRELEGMFVDEKA